MPHATNGLDRRLIYFEDDGGDGAPVVLHGGILDSVPSLRASRIAQALERLPDEFRLVFVDHRGLGRSDKPHDPAAYATPVRVADAAAVLDELGIERAHFIGNSWGGRLGFGIGEHAPERVLSLVIGGQQPYAIDPEGPLTRVVGQAVAGSRKNGIGVFVEALETFSGTRFPDGVRAQYLQNDAAAIEAAWSAAMAEGEISTNLRDWQIRCLIFCAVGDVDFHDQAQRAASEIPRAEFISIEESDHIAAHLEPDRVLPAILRTLRGISE